MEGLKRFVYWVHLESTSAAQGTGCVITIEWGAQNQTWTLVESTDYLTTPPLSLFLINHMNKSTDEQG